LKHKNQNKQIGEIKMTLKINKVDRLPDIARSGRTSPELAMIIETLNNSVKNNQTFSLVGIKPGNAFNSMQQRIRAQAKKLGFKIVIRFDAAEETLYFKATKNNVSVSAKETPGVSSKTTAKK